MHEQEMRPPPLMHLDVHHATNPSHNIAGSLKPSAPR